MKRHLSRFSPACITRLTLVACFLSLFCGLTAFAAEEDSQFIEQPVTPLADVMVLLPYPENTETKELYPSDVQAVITDTGRQIIKTYTLSEGQDPNGIPRNSFLIDGWRYEMTDITEKHNSGTDTRDHTETVEISTETNDINEIIKQLAPTLEYQFDDGYCGLLLLDAASIKCEAEGHKNSSYTVTATREYPHLSDNDLSLIPKTITENGRVLELDGVTWEVQCYTNVDYDDIPESYRAVVKYTARASRRVVTGYITTADYIGEVSRTIVGDTVYTVYFSGSKVIPLLKLEEKSLAIKPQAIELAMPSSEPIDPVAQDEGSLGITALIWLAAIVALLASLGVVLFLLFRNFKAYSDNNGRHTLIEKGRISAKKLTIDLSPNTGDQFIIEIDRCTAKRLNGYTIEVRNGLSSLQHVIAYDGVTYSFKADFGVGIIRALH